MVEGDSKNFFKRKSYQNRYKRLELMSLALFLYTKTMVGKYRDEIHTGGLAKVSPLEGLPSSAHPKH